MHWNAIRLELDRTRDFPNGSASRAYLLRLPLTPAGTIDIEAIERAPEQATVRRLWPSEPDISGHLKPLGHKWVFVAGKIGAERAVVSEFELPAISEGALLTLRENGRDLPFRVACLREIG